MIKDIEPKKLSLFAKGLADKLRNKSVTSPTVRRPTVPVTTKDIEPEKLSLFAKGLADKLKSKRVTRPTNTIPTTHPYPVAPANMLIPEAPTQAAVGSGNGLKTVVIVGAALALLAVLSKGE